MDELTLVVLAAGLGRRYGGDKQVEAVGPDGASILHYSIFDALRSGFSRVVLVVRPGLREILDASFTRLGMPVERIEYVIQDLNDLPVAVAEESKRQKPWGTAHAVYCCRHTVKGAFIVVNADDLYGPESYRLAAEHLREVRKDERLYGLVGYRMEETLSPHGSVSRAICLTNTVAELTAIHEFTGIERYAKGCTGYDHTGQFHILSLDATVSMNFWTFTQTIFADLEGILQEGLEQPGLNLDTFEFYLPEAVNQLMAKGRARVKVLPSRERGWGITYPPDLEPVRAAIETLHRKGVYPASLRDAFLETQPN